MAKQGKEKGKKAAGVDAKAVKEDQEVGRRATGFLGVIIVVASCWYRVSTGGLGEQVADPYRAFFDNSGMRGVYDLIRSAGGFIYVTSADFPSAVEGDPPMRGMASLRIAKKGDMLISVPASAMISTDTVDRDGKFMKRINRHLEKDHGLPAGAAEKTARKIAVIAGLIHQIRVARQAFESNDTEAPDVPFAAYLDTMPATAPANIMYWGEAERAAMQFVHNGAAVFLRDLVISSLKAMSGPKGLLPSLSDEEVRYGAAQVMSRSFMSETAPYVFVTPMIDLANHKGRAREANAVLKWHTVAEHGCYLEATKTIKPGEEVFLNYGEKGNAELLANYGFSLPPGKNPYNSVFQEAPDECAMQLQEWGDKPGVDPPALAQLRKVPNASALVAALEVDLGVLRRCAKKRR
eukprot:gnl/MRDRNA2_/MRDRNA2_15828_c0_seq1.p1 gnl/MRDRNA2_/MRDRNA2_15828_c0~~gnl/MRDRNA2_/MRDRNA2_15828_c0_seq1.p1  ORF type:complete len:407 (+),score=70.97 gnl/MRDRNA2_/MRDRNA2_15828_c0_seq1:100-1320(+)